MLYFDIPAQKADAALTKYARVTRRKLLFEFDVVSNYLANEVTGEYEADQALELLLKGSGLLVTLSDRGNVIIKADQSKGTISMNNLKSKKGVLASVISVLLGATAAQQGNAEGERISATQTLMENTVVTARKKSVVESAQDVPITLTAVTGDQIEAAFINDMTELGYTIPNVRLDVSSFPGSANYTIRGMGFISTIASAEPTVGTFVDGVYLGNNLGSDMGTYDLESVEVLRGPQGTLFGRNVTAGAIVMRSRRPDGEFGGLVRAGLGSNGRELLSGAIEGGLTDTVAAKIFAQYSNRDGDWNNTFLNEDHGAQKSTIIRPILTWNPSDEVAITAIYEYGDIEGDGTNGRILNDPTTDVYGLGIREPKNTEDVELNFPGETEVDWTQFTLEAIWEVGNGNITSITGYRDVEYSSFGDTDATSLDDPWILGFVGNDQDQFSQELRYASQALNDKLNYTVGLYYFEQSLDNTYLVQFGTFPFQRPRGKVDQETYSAFAHGDYEIIPDVYLTLGLRYDYEEKDAKIARGNANCDENFNCTYDFIDDDNWSNTSPKIGLSWNVNPNTMLYASWQKGFRSGGYNSRATSATEIPGPYDEEEVQAFEIGVKADFLDGKARLNAAVFHNEYDDLQRVISDVDISFSIQNAAKATIDGAEVELTILPTDNFAIQANIGYLDASYDDFPGLDVNGDGTGDPELAKGLQLVRAPDWTGSLTATLDLPLGDAGSVVSRVAYIYSDDSPMNDAHRFILDGYNLLDASVTWFNLNANLSVSLWGKNLTDEAYALTGATFSIATYGYMSLPRTYGAEVVYKFD